MLMIWCLHMMLCRKNQQFKINGDENYRKKIQNKYILQYLIKVIEVTRENFYSKRVFSNFIQLN